MRIKNMTGIILIIVGTIIIIIGVVLNVQSKQKKETRAKDYPKKEYNSKETSNNSSKPNKPGNLFEEYMIKTFNQEYFQLLDYTRDIEVNGIHPKSNENPDLLYEFKHSSIQERFAVECKWRHKFNNGLLQLCEDYQLKRYKQFAMDKKLPVFIALGLGGTEQLPEGLYIIPINRIKYNSITKDYLAQFQVDNTKKRFYSYKTKTLQ